MWAQPEPTHTAPQHFDAIIVGGGLAGVTAALHLPAHWRIALVLKQAPEHSASYHAQGGIAAVLAQDDSIAAHVEDTIIAGAGLCDIGHTTGILSQAGAAIAWLQAMGVPFSQENGCLHLTREGGHSQRRIVHAADATGHAVMEALWPHIARHPGITVLGGHAAIDLLIAEPGQHQHCQGITAIDLDRGTIRPLLAPHTMLATGGSGQLYPRTTNPAGATADGVAMAWRAGCVIENMEFIQFHPTGLAVENCQQNGRTPLISEAMRGEGALLRLPDGDRFMPRHDARAELAPRDIVARAIYREMQDHKLDHVDLDISHRSPGFLASHFPNLMALCRSYGIDPATTPIPVAPLAHYACGGIRTDLNGRTSLPGLYAIGECASTGLHGANRLASNSLLECVVMGRASARDALLGNRTPDMADDQLGEAMHCRSVLRSHAIPEPAPHSTWDDTRCAQARRTLQHLMWQGAGILRTPAGMARASLELGQLRHSFLAATRPVTLSLAWLELRNLLDVAGLVLDAASARQESVGMHALEHSST